MESDMCRNSNDIDDAEYARMRNEEDRSNAQHGEEADGHNVENADAG